MREGVMGKGDCHQLNKRDCGCVCMWEGESRSILFPKSPLDKKSQGAFQRSKGYATGS